MLTIPRFTVFLVISLILMALAFLCRDLDPLVSVSLYKAHLISLGGWGGYWLDRAAFPYGRPHQYCEGESRGQTQDALDAASFNFAGLRRAIIIAASLICAGLAA